MHWHHLCYCQFFSKLLFYTILSLIHCNWEAYSVMDILRCKMAWMITKKVLRSIWNQFTTGRRREFLGESVAVVSVCSVVIIVHCPGSVVVVVVGDINKILTVSAYIWWTVQLQLYTIMYMQSNRTQHNLYNANVHKQLYTKINNIIMLRSEEGRVKSDNKKWSYNLKVRIMYQNTRMCYSCQEFAWRII